MAGRTEGSRTQVGSGELFRALARTGCRVTRRMELLCKRHGLTATQYDVLRILREAGRQGTLCSRLGAEMVSQEPDVTRLLDRMEQRGWVERRRGQSDRRSVLVCITPEGRRMAAKLERPAARLYGELTHGLTAGEAEDLKRMLDALSG